MPGGHLPAIQARTPLDRWQQTERATLLEVISCDRQGLRSIFSCPGQFCCGHHVPQLTQENVMNEATEMELELEVVELGDAKEETKGIKPGFILEDGSTKLYLPAKVASGESGAWKSGSRR